MLLSEVLVVLPAFNCARAIDYLCSICLGDNILVHLPDLIGLNNETPKRYAI